MGCRYQHENNHQLLTTRCTVQYDQNDIFGLENNEYISVP